MSPKQKIASTSVKMAVLLSAITILFTVGSIPYKAGSLEERISECEHKVDKIDQIEKDVSYIRGWVDSQGANHE